MGQPATSTVPRWRRARTWALAMAIGAAARAPTAAGAGAASLCLAAGADAGACSALRRDHGLPCRFYRAAAPEGGIFGCREDHLCHFAADQRHECQKSPHCMYLGSHAIPGHSNSYGCVDRAFCGFESASECAHFATTCEWTSSNGCVERRNKAEAKRDAIRGSRRRLRRRKGASPPHRPEPSPIAAPTMAPTNWSTTQPRDFPTDFGNGTKPNIFFVLTDDLGLGDASFGPDPLPRAFEITPNMKRLAANGIVLDRHYAHWHCSPSRRSFLSGRLPIHTDEGLSNEYDDHMDLRWTWISEKLKDAGYYNVFFGKGHIGLRSWEHMPLNRGFDEHMGMLGGYADYRATNRWLGLDNWSDDKSYSTLLVGKAIEDTIRRHFSFSDPDPLFAFLAYQAPHSPVVCPSKAIPEEYVRYGQTSTWPRNCADRMVFALDAEMGYLEAALKDVGQWDNSLIVFSSDNGGSSQHNKERGNNFPFRGEKSTSFEGGIRVAAFLSGGFIPQEVRGTRSKLVTHISDWYATFCHLAGVDPADDPVSPARVREGDALEADIDNLYSPGIRVSDGAGNATQSLWGEESFPGIDAKNIFPALLRERFHRLESDAVHAFLPVTSEVIIAGDYKLVTAQPCELGILHDGKCKGGVAYGWIDKADQWVHRSGLESPENDTRRCTRIVDHRTFGEGAPLEPCLFDLASDPRETAHVHDEPLLLNAMWAQLNASLMYQYTTRIPGKRNGLTPASYMNCPEYEVDPRRINNDYRPVCDSAY